MAQKCDSSNEYGDIVIKIASSRNLAREDHQRKYRIDVVSINIVYR